MVDYTFKRLITIREMAFGTIEDSVRDKCDVVYMHSIESEPHPYQIGNKCIVHEQYTLENDLTLEEDEIFSAFNKNYKYEIRRAVKEGVKCVVVESNYNGLSSVVDEFESVYNKMFASKGMRNKFNRALVQAGLEAGNIVIGKAYAEGRDCVVYHAYLVDGKRTMLMYSASTLTESESKDISNLIGWMNKHLHWFEMLWFKGKGYLTYEWGGINSAENPNGIAKFKMGFGGEITKYVNYLVPMSILGQVYVRLVKMRGSEWK